MTAAVSVVTVATLVTTAAVVSDGYRAQRFDLGDGAVWVVNGQAQAIGRASTEVLELDTVVPASGDDLEVVQHGATVLLFDRTESSIDIVDPATSQVAESVPLPPLQPQVFLAGDRVVVFEAGSGEVRFVAADALAEFDAQSPPSLSLGTDAAVSVGRDGVMFAYSPTAGLIYRVDLAVSDEVRATRAVDFGDQGSWELTSVGGQWVALDAAARTLHLASGSVDLAAFGGVSLALQEPSTEGDRVLVASSAGLIAIPLSGGEPVVLVDDASGAPARPIVLDGCSFAGWAGGSSWRQCDLDDTTTLGLEGMAGAAQLSFASNGDRTVLNDRNSGESWAVQRSGELIDNWEALIPADEEQPQERPASDSSPPVIDTTQKPPVAVDDAFGARPGRATVLPVLLNDYDPNGDVLVVESVNGVPSDVGRIDLIAERQLVQLTLASTARGTLSLEYVISDGRGGTAAATVTVTIRDDHENSPPEQVRSTEFVVAAGGRVDGNVLVDWVDPDGDPFYLATATVASPDRVTHKPDGTVVYADAGSGGDLKTVTLVVSDGLAEGTGTASVSVRDRGEVPLVADPFVVLAYAGQELTVAPLDHVRGGTGAVRLNSIPSKPDVTITPSYETGTFRFVSSGVRSHYLEYVVTDGVQTTTGLLRVDVVAPPDASTTPITTPKTVFVQTLRNARVDVAGTDIDPAGGVLLVTGVMNVPAASGVRAEVLDQRIVRVSLDAPLPEGRLSFNYRVSNGLAEAVGVITVIEVPAPVRLQPPIAVDDAVTVRVGDAIDIAVLRNDEHPDGYDLTLDAQLDRALPDDAGLLFASGSVLRYLAPDGPGDFTGVYRVLGPDGQSATAVVRIAVREPDAGTNNAPVPRTVTARVLAGETVRIPIPLTAIDPDGDSVQLLGQSTNPEKGSVTAVESDIIVYRAGEYSSGTDSFSYTVIDALGARATGTVRVGISARLDGARNPIAVLDEVRVRPGFTVSVPVLENDSDPDGSPLRVVSAVPNDDETTATIEGDLVHVTPPEEPGQYGVVYGIANELGGTSQNFVRVVVDPDAPLARPIARDSVLTLTDVLDRETVVVDVLANVFFADGDPRSLDLSLHPNYDDTATVTASRRIEVTVQDHRQIIPFRVAHPDDDSVFTYAFIRVPGLDDALPQLDRRAPALTVHSEEELVIDLNDHVVAIGGTVRLTDSATVRATHADGSSLVRDADTLVYRSAEKYFGLASISFEVTDGGSAADPRGRTAILVLPITVLPRDNQPPVFNGAALDFEPGQQKVIDLLLLTDYPYEDDVDELAYSIIDGIPAGFDAHIDGTTLTITANASTAKGTTRLLSLGVRDDLSEGRPGRIQLSVVASTRPLLQPAPDTAIAARGQTTTVDVLLNDMATNPFPGEPLRVVSIRGLDGAALPPEVQVVPSADQSTLTVTVGASASPGDVNLQYQVADATGDQERHAWGSIRISVQDHPDPVTDLAATSYGDRVVTMRWNAGAANNAPITHYRVSAATMTGAPVATVECSGTTCDVPTRGNGSAHAIRVTVVAVNAIGESDPVVSAAGVWSDIVPPAPTGLTSTPLDHGLRLSWSAVSTPSGGSPLQYYRVTAGSMTTDVPPSACSGGTCSTDVVSASFANGVGVEVRVSARNDAYSPLSTWKTSEPHVGVPAGAPLAVSSPLATSLSDTAIRVDWAGVFDPNGRPVTQYLAIAYTGSLPTCAVPGPPGSTSMSTTATSTQFGGLTPNVTYSIVVLATNLQGCTASPVVVTHTAPGVMTAITTAGPVPNGPVFDFQLTGGETSDGPLAGTDSVYYRIGGGTARGPIALGSLLTGNGTHYGQELSVQVRACRSYDSVPVCQEQWSAPFALGTAVDPRVGQLTFVPDPVDPDSAEPEPHNGGTFSWLVWPAGAYEAVQFACGTAPGAGAFVDYDPAEQGACHTSATASEEPWLTIRVIANGGQTYDISYNGHDYD